MGSGKHGDRVKVAVFLIPSPSPSEGSKDVLRIPLPESYRSSSKIHKDERYKICRRSSLGWLRRYSECFEMQERISSPSSYGSFGSSSYLGASSSSSSSSSYLTLSDTSDARKLKEGIYHVIPVSHKSRNESMKLCEGIARVEMLERPQNKRRKRARVDVVVDKSPVGFGHGREGYLISVRSNQKQRNVKDGKDVSVVLRSCANGRILTTYPLIQSPLGSNEGYDPILISTDGLGSADGCRILEVHIRNRRRRRRRFFKRLRSRGRSDRENEVVVYREYLSTILKQSQFIDSEVEDLLDSFNRNGGRGKVPPLDLSQIIKDREQPLSNTPPSGPLNKRKHGRFVGIHPLPTTNTQKNQKKVDLNGKKDLNHRDYKGMSVSDRIAYTYIRPLFTSAKRSVNT